MRASLSRSYLFKIIILVQGSNTFKSTSTGSNDIKLK